MISLTPPFGLTMTALAARVVLILQQTPVETCLDHGSRVRNNASCGCQTLLLKEEAFEASTTGNV